MQFIMFIMLLFVFLFNLVQLIIYYDTFKNGLIKKLFVDSKSDVNVTYRNKKYHIRK